MGFFLDFLRGVGAGSGDSEDDRADGDGSPEDGVDLMVFLVAVEVASGTGDALF
jgi:hypothetical protein